MRRVLIFGSQGQIAQSVKSYLSGQPDIELNLVGREAFGGEEVPFSKDFAVRAFDRFQPDVVLNAAGLISAEDSMDLFRANADWPRDLLEICFAYSTNTRVILLGSAAEYGFPAQDPASEICELKPISEYGRSKVRQFGFAQEFRSKGLNVEYVRIFNFLSPRMSSELAFGNWLKQAHSQPDGGLIRTLGLESVRDFLDLRDVGVGLAHLICRDSNAAGDQPMEWTFNLCSGKPVVMEDLLGMLLQVVGKPFEVFREEGSSSVRNRATRVVGNPSLFFKRTGFRPQFALEETVRWCWKG